MFRHVRCLHQGISGLKRSEGRAEFTARPSLGQVLYCNAYGPVIVLMIFTEDVPSVMVMVGLNPPTGAALV